VQSSQTLGEHAHLLCATSAVAFADSIAVQLAVTGHFTLITISTDADIAWHSRARLGVDAYEGDNVIALHSAANRDVLQDRETAGFAQWR
jgi:hypothetical protein